MVSHTPGWKERPARPASQSANGTISSAANPNGAARNIAGVYNDERNVLGLMPHPERLSDAALGGTDGRLMIDSLVEALS